MDLYIGKIVQELHAIRGMCIRGEKIENAKGISY